MRLLRPLAITALALVLGVLPCRAAPGERDLTFAGTGGTRLGFGLGSGRSVALTQDLVGRQLLAGNAFDGDHYGMAVMAYLSDGTPDPSFAENGRLVVHETFYGQTSPHLTSAATAIRAYDSERFVVAGYYGDFLAGWDFLLARFRNDGTPDSTFGYAGFARLDVTGNTDGITAMVVQLDGKIVVTGTVRPGGGAARIAVVRFNVDGTPDATFTGDGIDILPLQGQENSAYAIGIDASNKIVVAGTKLVSGNNWNMLVLRYNTNGTLDGTFSGDGILEIDTTNGVEVARALWIQRGQSVFDPDKIIVAGESSSSVAVLRFNLDGTPDATFDVDGRVYVNPGLAAHVGGLVLFAPKGTPTAYYVTGSAQSGMGQTFFYAIKIDLFGVLDSTFDGDGIAVANTSGGLEYGVTLPSSKPTLAGWSQGPTGERFTLIRFETTGALDPTLDGDGIRTDDIGEIEARMYAMTMQADDKVIAVGRAPTVQGPGAGWAVMRLRADGEPDSTFSGDGRLVTPFLSDADYASAVAVQSDQKIVVVGVAYPTVSHPAIGVMRLLPNGDPDPTFDGDGRLTVPVQQIAHASAVRVGADGGILIGGWTSDGRNEDFLLVRLYATGRLDTSLDGDGIWIDDLGSVYDEANALAVLPDGRILLAGIAHNGVDLDFAVTRCSPNGALDFGFQSFGQLRTHLGGSDMAYDIDLLPDGRIVVGGSSVNGISQYAISRYLAEGDLDTSFDGDGVVLTGIVDGPGRLDLTAAAPVGARATSGVILDSQGRQVVIQPNEKLLMIGRASNNTGPGIVIVARYATDGSPDYTYGVGYAYVSMEGRHDDVPMGAALDSQNRLVIACRSSGLFGFARLLGDPAGTVETPRAIPTANRLALAGENPFRSGTGLEINLSRDADVSLEIYDVGGARVRTLARQHREAGRFRIEWDGTGEGSISLHSGVYLARLQVGAEVHVAKLVKLD